MGCLRSLRCSRWSAAILFCFAVSDAGLRGAEATPESPGQRPSTGTGPRRGASLASTVARQSGTTGKTVSCLLRSAFNLFSAKVLHNREKDQAALDQSVYDAMLGAMPCAPSSLTTHAANALWFLGGTVAPEVLNLRHYAREFLFSRASPSPTSAPVTTSAAREDASTYATAGAGGAATATVGGDRANAAAAEGSGEAPAPTSPEEQTEQTQSPQQTEASAPPSWLHTATNFAASGAQLLQSINEQWNDRSLRLTQAEPFFRPFSERASLEDILFGRRRRTTGTTEREAPSGASLVAADSVTEGNQPALHETPPRLVTTPSSSSSSLLSEGQHGQEAIAASRGDVLAALELSELAYKSEFSIRRALGQRGVLHFVGPGKQTEVSCEEEVAAVLHKLAGTFMGNMLGGGDYSDGDGESSVQRAAGAEHGESTSSTTTATASQTQDQLASSIASFCADTSRRAARAVAGRFLLRSAWMPPQQDHLSQRDHDDVEPPGENDASDANYVASNTSTNNSPNPTAANGTSNGEEPPRWFFHVGHNRVAYVVFRGTQTLDDWAVNLEVEGDRSSPVFQHYSVDGRWRELLSSDVYLKLHHGFYKRVQEFAADFEESLREYCLEVFTSTPRGEGAEGDAFPGTAVYDAETRTTAWRPLSREPGRMNKKHSERWEEFVFSERSSSTGGSPTSASAEFRRCLETRLRARFDRVVFAGHSLGGALALLLHRVVRFSPLLSFLFFGEPSENERTGSFSADEPPVRQLLRGLAASAGEGHAAVEEGQPHTIAFSAPPIFASSSPARAKAAQTYLMTRKIPDFRSLFRRDRTPVVSSRRGRPSTWSRGVSARRGAGGKKLRVGEEVGKPAGSAPDFDFTESEYFKNTKHLFFNYDPVVRLSHMGVQREPLVFPPVEQVLWLREKAFSPLEHRSKASGASSSSLAVAGRGAGGASAATLSGAGGASSAEDVRLRTEEQTRRGEHVVGEGTSTYDAGNLGAPPPLPDSFLQTHIETPPTTMDQGAGSAQAESFALPGTSDTARQGDAAGAVLSSTTISPRSPTSSANAIGSRSLNPSISKIRTVFPLGMRTQYAFFSQILTSGASAGSAAGSVIPSFEDHRLSTFRAFVYDLYRAEKVEQPAGGVVYVSPADFLLLQKFTAGEG